MPSFTSVVPPEAMHDLGTVDYLVVGAGAASMAFIDTLLKSQPKLKIAIVRQLGIFRVFFFLFFVREL